MLLNTDIKAEPGWLAALLGVIGSHPGAAAVSSKMMLYDRPRILNGVGGCMNRLGYTWDRGMFEEDRGQYDRISEILFASAAAALFDRERFLEVGGFDESFFMYHEDVDLCWRLWLRGYEVLSAPDAVVHHHFGATTRQSRSLSGESDWANGTVSGRCSRTMRRPTRFAPGGASSFSGSPRGGSWLSSGISPGTVE